jgi:hypothetical protein
MLVKKATVLMQAAKKAAQKPKQINSELPIISIHVRFTNFVWIVIFSKCIF